MRRRPLWWRRITAALAPRRSLKVVEGDMLPATLPRWNVVLARDGEEDWAVGLRCPCGCPLCAKRRRSLRRKERPPCGGPSKPLIASFDYAAAGVCLGLRFRRVR